VRTCPTWLGELLLTKPEECRAEIRRGLEVYGGNVMRTARALGVSRTFFWYCLRRLDMGKVPAEQRKRWAERFKVTVPDAASAKTEDADDARAD
jgi:hypothetical protein